MAKRGAPRKPIGAARSDHVAHRPLTKSPFQGPVYV